jgi:small subunit ribosomal protein S16
MVKIRLRRVGAKKQPSYRVVVTDSRSPRDGRFIETIGFYNPRTEPPTVEIQEDRALYWLSQGAQPTKSAAGLLTKLGTMERLARWKRGESLDKLLEEAAAAHAPAIEEASASKKKAQAQPTVAGAENAAAEAGMEAKEVTSADAEMNDTETANEEAKEAAEEEA